jgi:hypothetical protein
MKPIISVINNKGGTAKTTTVINTGEALSMLGKRVLIIGESAPSRHPIPVQVGTLFRSMPAGDSRASRQVLVI